jgi:hypothetical protein
MLTEVFGSLFSHDTYVIVIYIRKQNRLMKIIITIEDTENGEAKVHEERLPEGGETIKSVTTATALAEAMFDVMDSLGEQENK